MTNGMCALSGQDDSTIPDDSFVFRRMRPDDHKYDPSIGRVRPTSNSFDDHPQRGPVSVDLGCETEGRGEPEAAALRGHQGYHLVKIRVGDIRELGLGVVRKPGGDNPCHGLITGRKSGSAKKKLARRAEWVLPPPGVSADGQENGS
jgi:hypothetical protein